MLPFPFHCASLCPMNQLPSGIINSREARLGEAFHFKLFLAIGLLCSPLSMKLGVEQGDKKNIN